MKCVTAAAEHMLMCARLRGVIDPTVSIVLSLLSHFIQILAGLVSIKKVQLSVICTTRVHMQCRHHSRGPRTLAMMIVHLEHCQSQLRFPPEFPCVH